MAEEGRESGGRRKRRSKLEHILSWCSYVVCLSFLSDFVASQVIILLYAFLGPSYKYSEKFLQVLLKLQSCMCVWLA